MPYIKQDRRKEIDKYLEDLILNGPGDLNYAITRLILNQLGNVTPRYQDYNDAIGALEGCKMELYRRFIAPYEDVKAQENGDL